MFVGVEHVAIASPDPRTLAKWYVDHLAFQTIAQDGGTYFVKASNGAVLEIIEAKGKAAKGERSSQSMDDPGLRHVAIAVTDFDAALASLRAGAVDFLGEPYASPQGNRVVFFTDCEGNILHLIQRAQPLEHVRPHAE
jgi:glyoxylase I family protein